MSLEVGQYINDGENDLLICAMAIYKDNNYIYVLNEENDEVCFYEYHTEGDKFIFEEVTSDNLINDLILHFAKQELEKETS